MSEKNLDRRGLLAGGVLAGALASGILAADAAAKPARERGKALADVPLGIGASASADLDVRGFEHLLLLSRIASAGNSPGALMPDAFPYDVDDLRLLEIPIPEATGNFAQPGLDESVTWRVFQLFGIGRVQLRVQNNSSGPVQVTVSYALSGA